MKKQTLLLTLCSLSLALAGCQKSADQGSTGMESMASCLSSKPIDPKNLKIEGGEVASKGDAVRYHFNQNMGCGSEKSVVWRTIAGGKTLHADNSVLISKFSKPGEYVVAAEVSTAEASFEVSSKTTISDSVELSGPQIGMAEMEHHFELVAPAGVSLVSATWNFGDGSPSVQSIAAQDHTYWAAGDYTLTVAVTDSNGVVSNVSHSLRVIPPADGMECVRELSTSGPTQAVINVPVTMSVYLPPCMEFHVTSVRWNFSDGTPLGTSQTVDHTYTAPGTYTVSVNLYTAGSGSSPFVTLTRQITVLDREPEPEPEEPVEPEEPEEPQGPHQCALLGQTRTNNGEIYSEEHECGVMGTKTMSYRDNVNQTCQMVNDVRTWIETSRDKELLNEGECKGQACEIPASAFTGTDAVGGLNIVQIGGRYYLLDGGGKTFYSSRTPAGSCSEVAQTRTCDNGVLGGSTEYAYLSCVNGCAGVGPSGTTQTGVVIGQTTVPKQCQFGETGIVDTFTLIADRTCDRGEVKTSNSRTGGLVTAGLCPSYTWTPTENYTACTASCGGSQSQVFECRNGAGEIAATERCTGEAPVVTRVCDGAPDEVRRTESSTTVEEAGSSAVCPANEIGVVIQRREATLTKTYACIDHAVGLESEVTSYGPWVEERFCKEFVAHRCSKDSLSAPESRARYQWMQKCRTKIPAVDEFMTAFAKFEKEGNNGKGIYVNWKWLYPTFMDRAYNPPRVWKAPKSASAKCTGVPDTVYVAAVCTASCATPEQQILAQSKANGKLEYVKFFDAWNEKFQFVATLTSQSTMSSKYVQKTKVDQFVTELEDVEHDIYVLTMRSGGVLRLTGNHPAVTDQGTMKLIEDFKVGDNMIRLGGERDPIVSIKVVKYFGKVYNVFVQSSALHKNIVVTNGYLNGTAYFQNDGAQHLNRRLLRGALIRGAL